MVSNKLAFALVLMVALSLSFAENFVVVNSKSGLDVLSAVYYANVKGLPMKFMPITGNYQVIALKVGSGKDVLLIQSANLPVTTFLQSELEKSNKVTVFSTTDNGLKTNLDLAEKSGANKFIIIDPSFGQNAISVISYAKKTGSYVIFAYSNNIDDVVAFLDKKSNPKVTIFGYVDSKTKEKLAKYSPTTIGKGEDKYEDNVEIVSKVVKEFGATQAMMADGTYIEEGMTDGSVPVLLVSPVISDYTYNFVLDNARNHKLTYYTLVGNNLVTPVYDLKKRVEAQLKSEGIDQKVGVVVKFGQGIPGSQGVSSLDIFPVPYYIAGLTIESIKYNEATGNVELVVKSTAEGPEYYKAEIHIKQNGEEIQVLSDKTPVLLERGEVKGTEYAYKLPSLNEGKITADVVARFGETSKSLTSFASKSADIAVYKFVDTSDVNVTSASYKNGNLDISIKNIGGQDAYVQTSAELIVQGSKTTVKSNSVVDVSTNSITVVSIPVDLSDQDLEANKEVKVMLKYGAREGFLQKSKESVVPLKVEKAALDPLMIGLILLVIILLIVVVYFATRKEEKHVEKSEEKKHVEKKR